MKSNIV